MAKTPPLGIRLDPAVKAKLDEAAKADARTTASLINKILGDWCLTNAKAKGVQNV